MTAGTNETARRLIQIAEKLGGKYAGIDGSGHHVVDFAGEKYRLAATPGEYRGFRNAISNMERISGRKLPRQSSGHYSHAPRGSGFRMPTRPSRRGAEIDGLRHEADGIVAELRSMRSCGGSRDRALDLITRYAQISDRLVQLRNPALPELEDALGAVAT